MKLKSTFLFFLIFACQANAQHISCVGEVHSEINPDGWIVDNTDDVNSFRVGFDFSVPALIYFNQYLHTPAKLKEISNNIYKDEKDYVYYFSSSKEFLVITRVANTYRGPDISSTIFDCFKEYF